MFWLDNNVAFWYEYTGMFMFLELFFIGFIFFKSYLEDIFFNKRVKVHARRLGPFIVSNLNVWLNQSSNISYDRKYLFFIRTK